jgi:hypothetical protein
MIKSRPNHLAKAAYVHGVQEVDMFWVVYSNVGHGLHEEAPREAENELIGQGVHSAEPATENVPAGQKKQVR